MHFLYPLFDIPDPNFPGNLYVKFIMYENIVMITVPPSRRKLRFLKAHCQKKHFGYAAFRTNPCQILRKICHKTAAQQNRENQHAYKYDVAQIYVLKEIKNQHGCKAGQKNKIITFQ